MTWWITHAERTVREEVPAAPDAVRGFYVDLHNIKTVHPLVVSVRTISRDETADGYQQIYRVHDRIPLRMLTIRVSYRARLRVPTRGDVFSQARQFPWVRVNGIVTFEPIDSGTRVIERLRIATPRPLMAMTARVAVNAHITMLSGIRHHFEALSGQ